VKRETDCNRKTKGLIGLVVRYSKQAKIKEIFKGRSRMCASKKMPGVWGHALFRKSLD